MTEYSCEIHQLSLDGMARLGGALLQFLPDHMVIGLVGTLGAGKTNLTQAIARAAEIDPTDVTSPTFTLLQSHQGQSPSGPITLHHLDAYRIADEDEFLELGVDELFEQPKAWTIVEWADRIESVMPSDALWLKIEIESDSQRTVTAQSRDPRCEEPLADIAARFT